jgi:hypothetical protein
MLITLSINACTVKQEEADAVPSLPPADSAFPDGPIPTADNPLDKVGFYDPEYDYPSGKRYKVIFMTDSDAGYYRAMNSAFEHWASLMNIDYGGMSFDESGGIDAFINQLKISAEDDVDGILVGYGWPIHYNRISEVFDEIRIPWMSCGEPWRNIEVEGAPLLHPNAGVLTGDYNYTTGISLADKLLELKKELWPDTSIEETGFLTVYFSNAISLSDREMGAFDTWIKETGLTDNYFTADIAAWQYDIDGTPYMVEAEISENPQIKRWLIAAVTDQYAASAVEVLDKLKLTDASVVVSGGIPDMSEALIRQWDSGGQSPWKASLVAPYILQGEPIIGALYAFMSGRATPETIWPQWVNINDSGGEGGTYATLMLPSYWIDQDNYKRVLKWTDVYAGLNFFPEYPADGITPESYNARAEVPDYYSIKAQD